MKKDAIRKRQNLPDDPTEAAARNAEEAAQAKAEELRAALQSKVEQGQSSLGSLPARDVKKRRKR
jgi:hypothetical protein